MPNPLDQVTEDQRDDGAPLQRVYINGAGAPGDTGSAFQPAANALTQAVAPQGNTDIMALIQQVKNYLTQPEGFSPGTRVGNRLFGTGGEERYQTWPERMVRSGATLAGDVMSGEQPTSLLRREDVTDVPYEPRDEDRTWLGRKLGLDPVAPGPSDRYLERVMDMAGLAGGGALTAKPGSATLGSGPVRPAMNEKLVTAAKDTFGTTRNFDNAGYVFPDGTGLKMYRGAADRDMDVHAGVENLYQGPVEHPIEQFMNDTGAIRKSGNNDNYSFVHRPTPKQVELMVKNYNKAAGDYEFAKPLIMEVEGGGPAKYMEFKKPTIEGVNKWLDTLYSDTSKPGAAVSGALSSGPAPVFYSALEHATTNAAQDTMSPGQWLGYLKNQPGVKKEELQWTGLEDWLGQQQGKVKKSDVRSYLDEHKVEIKDVTKSAGEYDPKTRELFEEEHMERWADDFHDQEGRRPGRGEFDEERERIRQAIDDDPAAFDLDTAGSTKYSDYQLPGGENYREHLLTMPRKAEKLSLKEDTDYGAASNGTKRWQIVRPDGSTGRYVFAKTLEEANADLARLEKHNAPQVQGDYRSSHWDEPNVLAHVRTNDRMMGDQKSLHIEEIQSDWHQQGRKQGYRENFKEPYQIEETNGGFGVRNETGQLVVRGDGRPYATRAEAQRIADAGNSVPINPKGVPDAPFKTTWPELALKRMIRHAAEGGYDRISWTPGEAQAARYDLSKHMDELTYDKSNRLIGRKDKAIVFNKILKPEELADTVGKDVADKLIKQPGDFKQLEGVDLKVGGEGMREFYDKMLPKMVEKIGAKHGVRVKTSNIGPEPQKMHVTTTKDGKFAVTDDNGLELVRGLQSRELADNWADKYAKSEAGRMAQPVHYFDLPQSLKDHAMHKGFPLYMSGIPFPLTPVDRDPFKKDK